MRGGVHRWVRGRMLGRGSTASVFLAARATPGGGESFAVKSVELSRSSTLQREERILSSLCSPHVVSCLGSDVAADPDGRVLYNLFVEYVPGGTLSEAIRWRGGLDEGLIRLYTRGILRGLAYLHSVGVVHCDVKGENVLLGENGVSTKLADLGCARWVGGVHEDGKAISGTPMYMAPEVAIGEEQGTPADIWALGCTVIEMASGRPPWCGITDPVAAIHRIAFSADVPDFPCNVSDDARDFLCRCLKRDPRERWSAEQLLNHPFVPRTEEFTAECTQGTKKGSSPKSTLDHSFWDSWVGDEEEEEEEEEEGHALALAEHWQQEPPQERLRQLMGSSRSLPPTANSTWHDACWFTIRDDAEVDEIPTAAEEPCTSAAWLAGTLVGAGGSEESAVGTGLLDL